MLHDQHGGRSRLNLVAARASAGGKTQFAWHRMVYSQDLLDSLRQGGGLLDGSSKAQSKMRDLLAKSQSEIDELKRQLGQPSLQVDAGTGDSLEARFNRTQHELEAKTVQMKEKEKLLAERDAELAELRLVTERVTAARGGAALEEDRACCNLF